MKHNPCTIFFECEPDSDISQGIELIQAVGIPHIQQIFKDFKSLWQLPVDLKIPSHTYTTDGEQGFQASVGGVHLFNLDEYDKNVKCEIVACELSLLPESIDTMITLMHAIDKEGLEYAYKALSEDAVIALSHLNNIFPKLNTMHLQNHALFCSGTIETLLLATAQYKNLAVLNKYGVDEVAPVWLLTQLPWKNVIMLKSVGEII